MGERGLERGGRGVGCTEERWERGGLHRGVIVVVVLGRCVVPCGLWGGVCMLTDTCISCTHTTIFLTPHTYQNMHTPKHQYLNTPIHQYNPPTPTHNPSLTHIKTGSAANLASRKITPTWRCVLGEMGLALQCARTLTDTPQHRTNIIALTEHTLWYMCTGCFEGDVGVVVVVGDSGGVLGVCCHVYT